MFRRHLGLHLKAWVLRSFSKLPPEPVVVNKVGVFESTAGLSGLVRPGLGQVHPESWAEAMGFRGGEEIVAVNGTPCEVGRTDGKTSSFSMWGLMNGLKILLTLV